MIIKINDIEDMNRLGELLGSLAFKGMVISMIGELGSGKTTLSKSIAKGLGVSEYVTSPTFNLLNEYNGRLPFYHFDVYRLENALELDDLGFDDYFYGEGVSAVEWGDRISSFLPHDKLELTINSSENEMERIVVLKAYGRKHEDLLKELKK